MAVKVGINGFGRIGRNLFRAAHEAGADSTSSRSTTSPTPRRSRTCSSTTRSSGASRARCAEGDGSIVVDGNEIKVLAERDPAALPWGDLGSRS